MSRSASPAQLVEEEQRIPQLTAEEVLFDQATEGGLSGLAGGQHDPLFVPPPDSDDEDYERRKKKGKGKRRASSASVDNEPAEQHVVKKVTTTKKRKGARLGRLEHMLQGLPLEILGEILGHLAPVMLLRLSRTAKVFRGLILSKSSRVIWKRAFANDGIAELEAPDISEPKLASLIWDKECELCGRLKVHKICYAVRKRVCDSCFKSNLSTPQQIAVEHPSLHRDTFLCCPYTDTPPCRGGIWPGNYGFNTDLKLYLVPVVLEQSAHLFSLDDKDRLDDILAAQDEEKGSQAKKYVEWWDENLPKMLRDAKMLQAWQLQLDGSRSKGKRELKMERANAIRKHLEEAGYESRDIDNCVRNQNSEVYNLVDQPYQLSDRVWRKIQTPIFACVDKIKDQRLDAEAQRLVEEEQLRAREEQQRAVYARLQQALLDRMRLRVQAGLASSAGGSASGSGGGASGGSGARGEGNLEFGGGVAGAHAAQMLLDSGFSASAWPPTREEQALYLVQQIASRAQANAEGGVTFRPADLQLLEVAVSLMPASSGSGASAFALGGPLLPGAGGAGQGQDWP